MPYRPRDLEEMRKRAKIAAEKAKKKKKPKPKARPETKRKRIVREMQQGLGKAVEVKGPFKITPLKRQADKPKTGPKTGPKTEPKLDGSEYALYPGAAGRAEFEYGRDIEEVLADETVSPEIKERLEEEELYEGDYKGGRVGKGKKMKMKKGGSPKGSGKARRGYGKAMMGGGMVKTKRNYSGGGRLY